jgi:hypothetical protein
VLFRSKVFNVMGWVWDSVGADKKCIHDFSGEISCTAFELKDQEVHGR